MTTSTSPILGLVAPNGDDPLRNGDNVITQLRDQLEALLAPAWITNAGFTPGTGFSLAWAKVKRLPGGMAALHAQVTRTGSAITAPANGDITNAQIMTVPAGWVPIQSANTSWESSGSAGVLRMGSTIDITQMLPNGILSTGHWLQFGPLVYPLT